MPTVLSVQASTALQGGQWRSRSLARSGGGVGAGAGRMPSLRGVRAVCRPHSSVLVRAATPLAAEAKEAPSLEDLDAPGSLAAVLAAFESAPGDRERAVLLLRLARAAPALSPALCTDANAVPGCSARVWMAAERDPVTGTLRFTTASDSELHAGLARVALAPLQGVSAADVEGFDGAVLAPLGKRWASLVRSRVNGLAALLDAARQRARLLEAAAAAKASAAPGALSTSASSASYPRGPFPSLVIRGDGFEPVGAYAEAQAAYLDPAPERVSALAAALSTSKVGVVAHFYMDPEVQGVLTAAQRLWPHIAISDSLVMADRAVAMAKAGCTSVAVLGVDFMSENVRAMLDEAGYTKVGVHRMDPGAIGCSLADAADSPAYDAYLDTAATDPNPAIHVVYINTSLRTKARAQARVPTITCTSSNVVATVLAAFDAIPQGHVWYGPDAYMGANIAALLRALAQGSDEAVRALHPAHTAETVRALLPRFHYFREGHCVVHHMFGAQVADTVRAAYGHAFLAAHFEVPGEMFSLALEAAGRGAGVVGSTSNILDFILRKLKEVPVDGSGNDGTVANGNGATTTTPAPKRLSFVLGTETGMVTAIVRAVREELAARAAAGAAPVEVEIVFPVSTDAITTAEHAPLEGLAGLSVVPGPAGGEGCSAEGGCASCPYMKMNTLDALMGVCAAVADASGSASAAAALQALEPVPYTERVAGKSVAALGCETILHMRDFQRGGRLSDRLVQDVLGRKSSTA